MDLDVKMKAVMIGAVFLIVSVAFDTVEILKIFGKKSCNNPKTSTVWLYCTDML